MSLESLRVLTVPGLDTFAPPLASLLPQTAHLRRNMRNQRVKLTAGNLVLDCAIPSRLSGFLPRKGDTEFMSTR